jgi:hypothetical protein
MSLTLFEQRAGLDQLRIIPVNADVIGTNLLIGYMSAIDEASLMQGENFSINDEINPEVLFIFDKSTTLVPTATQKIIRLAGGESANDVAQLMMNEINDATLNILAESWGGERLRLKNTVLGKRVLMDSNVGNASFTITNSSINRYAFCLGSDLSLPPPENYAIGDKVSILQDVALTANTKLIRIQGRFRQPEGLPVREALPSSPTSSTVTRHDRIGVDDVTEITSPTNLFSSADDFRSVYITGAGVVAGTYRIFKGGYKYNSGTGLYSADAKYAILFGNDPLAAPGGPTNITGYMLGAHWKAKVILDDNVVFSFEPGRDGLKERDLLLPDLSINVNKYTVSVPIKYELELVETT